MIRQHDQQHDQQHIIAKFWKFWLTWHRWTDRPTPDLKIKYEKKARDAIVWLLIPYFRYRYGKMNGLIVVLTDKRTNRTTNSLMYHLNDQQLNGTFESNKRKSNKLNNRTNWTTHRWLHTLIEGRPDQPTNQPDQYTKLKYRTKPTIGRTNKRAWKPSKYHAQIK